MCTADGVPGGPGFDSAGFGSAGFGSVAEALRAGVAFADYLNSCDAGGLEAAALGEALVSIGEIQTKLAVAYAGFLFRFDARDGHDADGYATSSAWLAAMGKLAKRDAKAAVRRMRAIAKHPLLARGMAAGEISESWAREIAAWLRKLPEELREGTEGILAEAAAAGASLEDLAVITAHALAQWEAEHPDEDPEGGFPDRCLQIETTFAGAGVIRGDLTPECAAAVTAVLEALGKKPARRTTAQRRSGSTTRCSWRASSCCGPSWCPTAQAPTPKSWPTSRSGTCARCRAHPAWRTCGSGRCSARAAT